MARAGAAGRTLAFHVCNWLVPTPDLLLDRGMMGDGVVIDVPGIRVAVEAAGYAGMIEVEIFARGWWRRDPDEVLRIVAERSRCGIMAPELQLPGRGTR